MAGIGPTFGSNVDFAYGSRSMLGRQFDIAGGLQRGISGLQKFRTESNQTAAAIKSLNERMRELQADRGAAMLAGNATAVKRLSKEIENCRKQVAGLRQDMKQLPFDAIEKGLGSLTKGLLKFNTSILGMAFDFLIGSIKRVYELQERWTQAIGKFNMTLGGMTRGLQGAQKAAISWSGTIRGLTNGDIQEGIQMFAEFSLAIGRTVKSGDQFEKFGLQLARGFNLGGAGAGQLTKVLENINASGKEASVLFGTTLVKSAGAAGVPVNMLAKDILESSTYMARFGKESAKTFVTGAAFARKFTITMKELQGAVQGLDMFDEAAKTASRLNTVFGTMINSMDLMMEDDPAARIEMIRQQFLALGKTEDKMLPKEIRLLSEQLHLTEDQTRALLSRKNAAMSYSDFQKKAAATEAEEAKAKRNMELMLRKTAQTMFAFGAAFDDVTRAIAAAIKPLLVVFGLAKEGDKNFTSFGEVMKKITKTVEAFFYSLAKDPRWQGFMKELARDMIRAGHAIKEFVLDGRAARFVGNLAEMMKKFYTSVRDLALRAVPLLEPVARAFLFLAKHVEKVAIAWAAMKGINMLGGGNFMAGAGKIGGGMKAMAGSGLGRAGMGAGAGMLAGSLLGGTGAQIGGMVGGIAGSFLGPIGMIAGPIVGSLIGKGIEYLIKDPKGKSSLQEAQESLTKTVERERLVREGYESMLKGFQARRTADDTIRRANTSILTKLEAAARRSKEKEVILSKEQAQILAARSHELTLFGRKTKVTEEMLSALGEGSRLTAGQLKELLRGSEDYEAALEKLRGTSEKVMQQQLAQLQVSQVGTQKAALESIVGMLQAGVKSGEVQQKSLGRFQASGGPFAQAMKFGAGGAGGAAGLAEFAEMNPKDFANARKKLNDRERQQLDLEIQLYRDQKKLTKSQEDLVMKQSNFLEQQTIIQLRALEFGSERFLSYLQAHPGMAKGAAFEQYLAENKDALEALYMEGGYKMLTQRPKMASGGIVTRPTNALIGESGAEAVIPLNRAMARGRLRNAGMGRNVSFGAGGALGGTEVVTVATDVVLDGQKVGRALVRTHVTGRN